MLEERTIRAALKVDANQIHLPDDLLERINRRADRLATGQSIWLRLRLGAKLEVAAVCILLVSMIGLGLVRHRGLGHAPGGEHQETHSPQGLPAASDLTKAYFAGYPAAADTPLDRSVVTMLLGWLKGAQVVGPDKEIPRRRGPDFYLVMESQGGDHLTVHLAADCIDIPRVDGTTSSCRRADGQVTLFTRGNEPTRLLAPELASWLLAQSANPPLRVATTGIDDFGGANISLTEPTSPAKLAPEEATAVAEERYGPPPEESPVTVEYKLLTDSTNQSRPVYLVTYHNLPPVPSMGPVHSEPPPLPRRLTVFVDANTGEHLYALSR